MDLELSGEQIWLSESLETLLEREWTGAQAMQVVRPKWRRAVAGARRVRRAEHRARGRPRRRSSCAWPRARWARASRRSRTSAVPRCASPSSRSPAISQSASPSSPLRATAWRSPSSSLSRMVAFGPAHAARPRRVARRQGRGRARRRGRWLAVVAVVSGAPGSPSCRPAPRGPPSRRNPPSTPRCRSAPCGCWRGARGGRRRPGRQPAAGAHVRDGRAAGGRRAVGAAGALLHGARRYAGERRQFGRTIGSNQALRHLLAQMYVRHASSWSTVLAAAALDDDSRDTPSRPRPWPRRTSRAPRARSRTARCRSSAASPSPRSTRRIALRRIVVREQQFGDAAHHERALGRRLADRAAARDRPASYQSTPSPVS